MSAHWSTQEHIRNLAAPVEEMLQLWHSSLQTSFAPKGSTVNLHGGTMNLRKSLLPLLFSIRSRVSFLPRGRLGTSGT